MSAEAFGHPGLAPLWTHADKDGVGTAPAQSSRIWFTLWNGILTEVYYPTVDRPQLRDLQYLITDGQGGMQEEKRDLRSTTERLSPETLGYRITNADLKGRFTITKEVIAAPHLPCILQHTTLAGAADVLSGLHLYVLCAPHLEVGGWDNNATVVLAAGRQVLTAEKEGTWLALAATIPFARVSCGYVGRSDGWTDLADNGRMDWSFDSAPAGNVALMGELDVAELASTSAPAFTLGLALGNSRHNAVTTLFESLGLPFAALQERYVQGWQRSHEGLIPLAAAAGDGGHLYHGSVSLIRAHEDKIYPGAFIASLSIPWGEVKGDDDTGGYHLVWTRDMVQSATALLAAGDKETPLRALIYLATSQQDDGGFAQNFWIDGTPYWSGIQLDEVAFPIMLAWLLHREDALFAFDPYPMVLRAAGYLLRQGPVTAQERWEEASGYSPSTLAACIAALICTASFARERGDTPTAEALEVYADFLEEHVESWTVTTQGTLVPGITRHYIRIRPADPRDPHPDDDPNSGTLTIANRPPGTRRDFPAKEVVDAGFLQLVRFGIRAPDDPLITASLQVVDAVLKVETPAGPCWHRYNHDGYGQREDGGPFVGWGTGRAWPLLTGERGHYELSAGCDARPFLRALEGFAGPTGLLPEQVWDQADRPDSGLYLGGPTGAARPLVWAHAEYVKLLRSVHDGQVFDLIPAVAQRYLGERAGRMPWQIWTPTRQVETVEAGATLRIQAPDAFRLHWSRDDWHSIDDTEATPTALGIHYVDIPIPPTPTAQQASLRFTFFWTANNRWEGQDYQVVVR